MPKRYTAKEVLKTLKKLGFTEVSQKGSHIKLKGYKDGKLQIVVVPNHKQIAIGTFSSILRQANLTKLEFENGLTI